MYNVQYTMYNVLYTMYKYTMFVSKVILVMNGPPKAMDHSLRTNR